MLLEITYKNVANILHARLLPIEDLLDREQQCGFRPKRSCIDAIFTIKSAIRKRSEHGLEYFFSILLKHLTGFLENCCGVFFRNTESQINLSAS